MMSGNIWFPFLCTRTLISSVVYHQNDSPEDDSHKRLDEYSFIKPRGMCTEIQKSESLMKEIIPKLHLWNMAHSLPTMISIRRFRVAQELTRGCRPKALPNDLHGSILRHGWTSNSFYSHSRYTRTQSWTPFLGRGGTACCKLPKPEMAYTYILGRTLGLT